MENQRKSYNDQKLYDEVVIDMRRVTKVTKGGRALRFSVSVAVGDRKGKVGFGTGKANEVPEAISKAIKAAEKNIFNVKLVGGRTIAHEVIGECGAAKVMIRPAAAGRGIVAGGPIRSILELAGVKDVVSKSLGSNTKINTSKATINALKQQKNLNHIAELRGKKEEEIR